MYITSEDTKAPKSDNKKRRLHSGRRRNSGPGPRAVQARLNVIIYQNIIIFDK